MDDFYDKQLYFHKKGDAMKLNMSVFYDWLQEFQPTAEIHSDAIEIDTVRLFSNNITPKSNCLYIGKMSDLFKNGDEKVICTHNNDILILNTDDENEVLNSVLNALEFYSKWNNELLELLSANSMLQDLLNSSENVLQRPIFLLDSGQRLLAMSQNYPLGSVDAQWDELIVDGSSNMEMLLILNSQQPERFQKKGIHTLEDGFGTPHQGLHYNFFVNEKWVGKLVMIDLDQTVTNGEACLLSILCEHFDKWFSSHIQELDALQQDRLLCAALANADNDNTELIRSLNINRWQNTDTLIIIQVNAPYQPYNINNHFCRTINHQFSNVFAVNFHYSICLLCNLTLMNQQKTFQKLLPLLQSGKYYGVVSQQFTMMDSFYKNYLYTDITGEYCEKKPGQLYDGEDYIMKYIFHEMPKQTTADLCHPALRKLLKYDETHDSEFAQTLKVYLTCERSNIETAKALNLHRNSLSYRLKKLQELLDANLNDADTRLHLLLSFQFLEQKSFS